MVNCKDEKDHYHAFVDYSDYIRDGWNARVTHAHSERVGTIRENLRGIYGESPSDLLGLSQEQSAFMIHMSPSKVIGR